MTDHHIPALAPVRTDADLLGHWRALMSAGGFTERSLWMTWFDERGNSLPIIVPIDDVPEHPDERLVDNLISTLGQIIDESEASTAAVLLSRPGDSRKGTGDLIWARALLVAARRQGVPMWPIHLATANQVQPFTPDDLVAAG